MHPDFIGRKKELALLKQQLLIKHKGQAAHLIALYGEGGIGKTELAIAFANNNMKRFSLVAWIDGSTEETLVLSYARLGDILGIWDENPFKRREKINWHLENSKGKPWLLIFDDLRELPGDLPKRGGAILVTCRDRSLCPPKSSFELLKNPEEAIMQLSKITGQEPSEPLKHLAEQLDYLPLMINLAGHYIAATPGSDITNYSEILNETMKTEFSPLKWLEFQKRYSKSLFASYHTTLQLLEKKHPLSVKFLRQAAMLYNKNIPKEFLLSWLKEQDRSEPAQTLLVAGDILRELQNHSLIRYDSKKGEFSIHQLLHHVLAQSSQKEEHVNVWVKILSDHGDVKRFNPTQKDSIRPFQRILPHAIKIIDQISVPDIPNMQTAHLSLTVARYFIETEHNLQKGKSHLDRAQKWSDNWDHPLKGRVAFLQGMLLFRLADQSGDEKSKKENYQEALAHFEKALDIFLVQNQNDLYLGIEQNPSKCTKEYQRAICMQYQAQTMRVLGYLDEAEKRLDEAMIAFQEFTHGKDHFDIARILREQALILWEKGKHEEAIAKLESAIRMQKKVYGELYLSQPTVAATHRILGDFYYKKGDYHKAELAYQFAIDVNQSIYQSDAHPYQADLNNLKAQALKALKEQKSESQ